MGISPCNTMKFPTWGILSLCLCALPALSLSLPQEQPFSQGLFLWAEEGTTIDQYQALVDAISKESPSLFVQALDFATDAEAVAQAFQEAVQSSPVKKGGDIFVGAYGRG